MASGLASLSGRSRVELATFRELRGRFKELVGIEGGPYEGWELGDASSDEAPAA
jgi:hypothetical protein